MTSLRAALASGPQPGKFTPEQYLLADLLGIAVQGTPMGTHVMRWLGDVQIGDVVIEVTSAHRNPWEHCIGILVREYDEPYLDEDGSPATYDGRPSVEHKTNVGEITYRSGASRSRLIRRRCCADGERGVSWPTVRTARARRGRRSTSRLPDGGRS